MLLYHYHRGGFLLLFLFVCFFNKTLYERERTFAEAVMQNGCALNMRWKGLLIKQCMVLKGLLIKGLCTSSWDREFFISRHGVGG